MSEFEVLCDICKKRIAKNVCKLCGRRICNDDFDMATGLCKSCKRGRV
ncbi:MAG: hypothetical protein LVQ97_02355 [Candidatus Micrarchaeales archaeon]|nr:hypothetical protein [Candidatus Micrarchaeales archaeon]